MKAMAVARIAAAEATGTAAILPAPLALLDDDELVQLVLSLAVDVLLICTTLSLPATCTGVMSGGQRQKPRQLHNSDLPEDSMKRHQRQ